MFKTLAATTAVLATSAAAALPADAASAKTYHYFSKVRSSQLLDASAQPIDRAPVAGDVFIQTDDNYLGTAKKHAKRVSASDHIVCTFLAVDPTTSVVTALCDGQVALPGGMILSDRQRVTFGPGKTVFKLTGGTGKYRHLKSGTVTNVPLAGDSGDSELIVTI